MHNSTIYDYKLEKGRRNSGVKMYSTKKTLLIILDNNKSSFQYNVRIPTFFVRTISGQWHASTHSEM